MEQNNTKCFGLKRYFNYYKQFQDKMYYLCCMRKIAQIILKKHFLIILGGYESKCYLVECLWLCLGRSQSRCWPRLQSHLQIQLEENPLPTLLNMGLTTGYIMIQQLGSSRVNHTKQRVPTIEATIYLLSNIGSDILSLLPYSVCLKGVRKSIPASRGMDYM